MENYSLEIETESSLNHKILTITMIIKNEYSELSKYIEEMQTTIPYKENPKITTKELKIYYDSLFTLLSKYKLTH